MKENKWELSRFTSAQESPGFLLWQVYLVWKRKIESRLEFFNLTHIQFVLLAGLAYLQKNNADVSQVELANFTQCDVAMTSQVLRTLVKKNLIERYQKPDDERAKYPRLTAHGLKTLESAIKEVESIDHNFFNLGADYKIFLTCLQQLITR
ncbi:MAG: MarR family winged helix-turn-helix transcriptional regulator [Candidatus Babeliales bacterium]